MASMSGLQRNVSTVGCFLALVGLASRASAQCGPDGQILTRADLNTRLGAGQILEHFEAYSVVSGGSDVLNVACLDSTGTAHSQGPGLLQAGATYCDPTGHALQWNGDQYYQLATKSLLADAATGELGIQYTVPVNAVGFDVCGFVGYGHTGTATFFDLANVQIGSVAFQIVNGGSERFFVGFAHAAGIGRVSIASSTFAWSPLIDDHGYGTCAATTTYCTSGTTSHGCVPAISGTGTASASASSGFTIAVSHVEGQKQGLLFYGVNNSGFAPLPWGPSSSYLCVKPPTQRMGVQSSGGTANLCDGALASDWNAFRAANPSALGHPFSAGQSIYAQGWFRDPASPKSTMLSNALQFTVQP
jgi:hypothetical protein